MKSNDPNHPPPDKTNFLISFLFHGVIILALVVMAAHEGLLGKQLKKIAVEVIHEKPPEKPKPPEKKEEPPKIEPPKAPVVVQTPTPAAAKPTPPPSGVAAAVAVAPALTEIPAFAFDGGKSVQSSSDPVELYRSYVESSLRSKWNRPTGIADDAFVAEVEVSVTPDGEIGRTEWKKNSGNAQWDESIKQAIAAAQNLDRHPPTYFPGRVLVRFDVQDVTEPVSTIIQ